MGRPGAERVWRSRGGEMTLHKQAGGPQSLATQPSPHASQPVPPAVCPLPRWLQGISPPPPPGVVFPTQLAPAHLPPCASHPLPPHPEPGAGQPPQGRAGTGGKARYLVWRWYDPSTVAPRRVHVRFPTQSSRDLKQAGSLLRVTWAVRGGVRRCLERSPGSQSIAACPQRRGTGCSPRAGCCPA